MPVTGPDPAPVAPISRHTSSVARLLRAASLVLALLFVLRVLLSLGPLRSGPLEVLLRFCEAMVGQAPFAVLVVCLIGLSLLIDEEGRTSRRLARGLRAAALPLAFVYLLLIPLYGTAYWWQSRSQAATLSQGLQASLKQLQNTRRIVQRASSSEQLTQVWASLPPGSPPLTRFGSTPNQQRAALERSLDRVNRILLARLAGVETRLLVVVVRDIGVYALACLGLALLFHRSSQLELPTWHGWGMAAGQPTRQRRSRRGNSDHDPATLDEELKQMSHNSSGIGQTDQRNRNVGEPGGDPSG